MENFKLIYDFGNDSIDGTIFCSLLPFLIVFLKFIYEKETRNETQEYKIWASFSIFFLVIFLLVIPYGISDYYTTVKIHKNKTYKIIEGLVDNYEVMPKDRESFDIKGIAFEISYNGGGYYGYHHIASKGGAIKEGQLVRICYYNKGSRNAILRLETK